MADEVSSVAPVAARPYFVKWRDANGVEHKIRRVPPRPQHQMLPEDKVELSIKRNDDFQEGDKVKIKHISPRHPNTLQLINDDGVTTFVGYHEVTNHEPAARKADTVRERLSNLKGTRYLTWP